MVRLVHRGLATFRGSHNKAKTLVMSVLAERKGEALTAFDIWWYCGVPFKNSLLPSLYKWAHWGYVKRSLAVDGFGNEVYHYKIAKKGRRFLYIARQYAPFNEYRVELEEHNEAKRALLATGRQFNSARACIDALEKIKNNAKGY